jgi:hypothetical protein
MLVYVNEYVRQKMVGEKNKNLVSLVPKPLAEEVATMNA